MADEVVVSRDGRKYKNLVTDIGQAKIALAALEGRKVNIVEMAVGDGGGGGEYYLPSADQTALRHEVWRGGIAKKEINRDSPNMIDVRTVLDTTVGGFTAREAALYDTEGDMIVVGNLPDIEKAVILEGISSSLTILLHVVFSNTDAVEITVNSRLDAVTPEELADVLKDYAKTGKPGTPGSAVTLGEDGRIPAELLPEGTAGEPGEPGGSATLDDTGKIPEAQLPWQRVIVAARPRDSGKPDYGLGGGGAGAVSVALETGPYTGRTEAGVVISGVLYDAQNVSTHGDTAPGGTILIKTEEQENG